VILPSEIVVSLLGPDGRAAREVLVALDFQWHGRFYYSHPFGLSDDQGQVRVSGEDILATFRSEQVQFPMDLKVPLLECDPEAIVRVMGGAAFLDHRRGLMPGWVKPEWIARWNQAQIGRYDSDGSSVKLTSPTVVRVTLELRVVGDGSDARAV